MKGNVNTQLIYAAVLVFLVAVFGTGTAHAQYAGVPSQDAAECSLAVTSEPASAGLSQIHISAPCFKGQKVHLRYDHLDLIRGLDETGSLSLLFDCYLGDKPPLTVVFEDGSLETIELRTLDLDRVTKVTILWKGGINLDLHAFEYAAGFDDDGHIWTGHPGSRWEVEEAMRRDKRGHGFLSFESDGTQLGDQLEVYTFVHEHTEAVGAIKLALDYESRAHLPPDPDTCGTGLYADVEFKVTVWTPKGHVTRSKGSFAPTECNKARDLVARYNSKAIPQLILNPNS